MTLETYLSYVKEDLRATRKAWLGGVGAFAALVVANHFLSLTETDYELMFYFALIFAACAPGLPYRRLIWVTPQGEGPRTPATFWIGFLRGLPGTVPLILFIVWLLTHFNLPVTIASRFKGYPIIPRSAHLSEYVLCFCFALVFLVYSEIFSAAIGVVEKGHLQTKDKKQRFRNHALATGICAVAMTLASAIAWLAFCLFYEISVSPLTWTLVVLAVPGTTALVIWTYRSWAASG